MRHQPSEGRHRRGRPSRLAAVGIGVLAGCLVSGCGLRVPSGEVRAATAAAEGQGSGAGGSGASQQVAAGGFNDTNAGSTGGSEISTASNPGGAGGTGGGSAGGTGAGSSSGGGGGASGSGGSGGGGGGSTSSPAAPAPPGGNGGATDVGVTANTITVGNVSDVGGPVPGLFEGGPYGVQAYFDYINSLGGIYGRQLKLVTSDDSLQCSQNESDYSNLVSSVFAFVGSWSLDDNCGAIIMKSHPNVPLIQTYLSPDMGDLPDAYGVAPFTQLVNTGPFLYFKQKYPNDITSVGTLVGNQGSAVAAWQRAKQAIESIGYRVTYEDDFPPAQSNFTSDVIRMKAQGIKMVILLSINAPDAAIFASEAAQQGFTPDVWLCPVCYAGSYISESGGPSAVNGQYAYVATADFLGDPSVPEVSLYLEWIHKAFPNFTPDEFSAYSWANAALFVNALKQAGPDLTQKKLLDVLGATTTFNDNGMVTSAVINSRTPSNCYNIVRVVNGNWAKVDDPPTGYRCDGTYVP